MPTLRILDSITDRGNPRADLEDAHGGNRNCVFVIDGATGLDGDLLGLEETDAAWLARCAKDGFEELVTNGRSVPEAVRMINERIARVITQASEVGLAEKWRLPVAGFQLVRVQDDNVMTYGLGDCRLFLLDQTGVSFDTTSLPDFPAEETQTARAAIAQHGGFGANGSLNTQEEVRARLRARRAGYNAAETQPPIWTLGTEPQAADHVVMQPIPLASPMRGLLCSDGFAALVDRYRRHTPRSLVETATGEGLLPLLTELRRIEQREDPDGKSFPRFKRSDDATAVLFEIV